MMNVDLNLTRVFIAIHETGSLSAAALRLNISQPAVSHALARLRDVLHNPLFQRKRYGMEPTPLAEQIYPAFRQALSAIEATMLAALTFEPTRTRRKFRIAMTDFGEISFLPAIMRSLALQAPMADLDVLTVHAETIADILLRGRADLAICPELECLSTMRSELIFAESYRCIHRIGHPRVTGHLSLSDYLAESHVVSQSSTGHTIVESYWNKERLKPRVALRLPNLGVTEAIVAKSDYLATVPTQIAGVFVAMGRVGSVDLPLPLAEFDVRLYWRDQEPPIEEERWFRNLILQAIRRL